MMWEQRQGGVCRGPLETICSQADPLSNGDRIITHAEEEEEEEEDVCALCGRSISSVAYEAGDERTKIATAIAEAYSDMMVNPANMNEEEQEELLALNEMLEWEDDIEEAMKAEEKEKLICFQCKQLKQCNQSRLGGEAVQTGRNTGGSPEGTYTGEFFRAKDKSMCRWSRSIAAGRCLRANDPVRTNGCKRRATCGNPRTNKEGCNRRATYGEPGRRALYCSHHKSASSLLNFHSLLCGRKEMQASGCQRRALYGMSEGQARFCGTHKNASHINCDVRRCDFQG
ncbi:hypothetical protein GUITHDRAFT_142129 [Guillardia theta CCMP2712]|uniref:Uncharacterized protein n=1 Tax=Guillardia theta (strain CCMP2712) TaxID=905079 RepID=L1IZ73_GUITC|nr:hypothetical protein GUITHDRAFT_142129 [Guillardia theta CCMP2712]EKX41199.1 hypothetical protein GUITHDRAFT_142129 [Guillardia theta CCMP2712]|eukprot:XP_005828179.1 hypothetical protein GUITHDRAFT_142129 [Guillardia theta CCMP2712]